MLPTKQGVSMDMTTWCEFCEKMKNFSHKYVDTGFIANNKVSVLNDKEVWCVIQGLYSSQDFFALKDCSLRLSENETFKLTSYFEEINNKILSTQFGKILPDLFLQCKQKVPCKSTMHEEKDLLKYISDELKTVLDSSFKCYGCSVDYRTQSLHACFTATYKEKFLSVGSDVIVKMNMFRLVKNICLQSCMCYINETSFNQFNILHLREKIEECIHLYL